MDTNAVTRYAIQLSTAAGCIGDLVLGMSFLRNYDATMTPRYNQTLKISTITPSLVYYYIVGKSPTRFPIPQ